MSAYYTEADYEAARRECYEAREAAREREGNTPLSAILDEFRRRQQQRHAEGEEAARRFWGSPAEGGSFTDGSMGRTTPFRNARIVR